MVAGFRRKRKAILGMGISETARLKVTVKDRTVLIVLLRLLVLQ